MPAQVGGVPGLGVLGGGVAGGPARMEQYAGAIAELQQGLTRAVGTCEELRRENTTLAGNYDRVRAARWWVHRHEGSRTCVGGVGGGGGS